MPDGRPTLYRPEYCAQLIEYFSRKPHENGEANDFPTLAGFAIQIGVHRETLLNWCDVDPEFFDAYKRAKDYQENFLVINAMRGLANPAFAIFTAKNVLGWRDKQDIEHSGKIDQSASDKDVDARIEYLERELQRRQPPQAQAKLPEAQGCTTTTTNETTETATTSVIAQSVSESEK